MCPFKGWGQALIFPDDLRITAGVLPPGVVIEDEPAAVSSGPSSSSRPSSTSRAEPSLPSHPETSSDAAALMPMIRQLTSTIDNLTNQVADLQQQRDSRETRERSRSRPKPAEPEHPPKLKESLNFPVE